MPQGRYAPPMQQPMYGQAPPMYQQNKFSQLNKVEKQKADQESQDLRLKLAQMELELKKVKTNLIVAENQIADNQCLYCLEFMSSETQYNRATAPNTVRLTCNHCNFHLKCAQIDLERRKICPVCRAKVY